MAGTVGEAADGLVTQLETISGVRAFAYIPDSIAPPCAVVALNGVDTFHGAQQGGLPTYQMRVTMIVANLSNRSAFSTLFEFASYSGTNSVRAAIEADSTLGGVVSTCVVERLENVGELPVGNTRYLAADFVVTVYA